MGPVLMRGPSCGLTEIECRRQHGSGEVFYEVLLANRGSEFGGVGKPRVMAPACAYERALEWAAAKDQQARSGELAR
jgi:hypothetical protein